VPDYWPLLQAYHDVRELEFRTIIEDAHLAPDARILDAGCGDAFYSHLLIDVLGPQACVVAVDHNRAAICSQPQAQSVPQLCVAEVECAPFPPRTFDAVWLCRSLHSASDAQRHIAALVPLLRSGGRLIVIENDLAHCPILSWPSDFEQRLPPGVSIERYFAARHLPHWFERAGLLQISIHTYSVEDIVPMPPAVEQYWKLTMDYRGRALRPFLSPQDWTAYSNAFDAESDEYVLRRTGFYCLEPITVAHGTAP
jgi:SAM-dependent methyltransferase